MAIASQWILMNCVSVALSLYLRCPRTELSLVTNGDIHKTMDVPGSRDLDRSNIQGSNE